MADYQLFEILPPRNYLKHKYPQRNGGIYFEKKILTHEKHGLFEVQVRFPNTNTFRGNFHQFILRNEIQAEFKGNGNGGL